MAAKGDRGKPGGGGGSNPGICTIKDESACTGSTAEVKSRIPADWELVFNENFDLPSLASDIDRSGTLNFRRWSTRYPFGDWKSNTAGNDDMWNVNTTGLDPGIGFTADNIYPDMETFMNRLGYTGSGEAQYDIFNLSNDGLVIQAHRNPWKHRINGRENYLAGMISSHAKPDTGNPHGFEFTYGYIEARARVPKNANGFRAALWLYSDNAYYNSVYGRPPVYEMDFLEYLPNTPNPNTTTRDCFVPQADVFGISGNQSILTYDTIFHTYHFPGGRTPYNWTFNNDGQYNAERCALDSSGKAIDYGNGGFTKFGLLWQADSIEWYVDDVLVHRVSATEGSSCTADLNNTDKLCGVDVYNGRMYLIASMHMGNGGFEGSVDTSAFGPSGGPEFEIDYIRVYQGSSGSWCGHGGADCSMR